MKIIKVLIVDDSVVIRQGITAMLSTQSDISIVGAARNGEEAITIARQEKPDVVLLDLDMPKLDGFGAISGLHEVAPSSKILIFTAYGAPEKVFRAIKTGAIGYLLKDSTWEQILQAIRDVSEGQAFIDSSVAFKLIQEYNLTPKPAQTPPPAEPIIQKLGLTKREFQVLNLLAKGKSNHEIAAKLVLQEPTVAKYVGNVLEKMQVTSRTQAAIIARDEGMGKTESEPDEKE